MNLFAHPITHLEDIREDGETTPYNQHYILPSDCENNDNVGKVNFLWTHQIFYNQVFGTFLTDASYTFSIVGGNGDSAFSINTSNGELTVQNASLFTQDRYITVRVSVLEWHEDTVCKIERATTCVYFDSTVSSGQGSGTRNDPYLSFSNRASILQNGTSGTTYLWKRGQTFSDYTKIRNPLVGGNLPDWITFAAWGQGVRPTMSGAGLATSNRFIDLGSSLLNDTVNETTNPEYVGHRVRIFDIETIDGGNSGWYPFQINMWGRELRFHRIKSSMVLAPWENGFWWFRNTMDTLDNGSRDILQMDTETYDSEFRSIKYECGGVKGRNYRAYTTLLDTEHPVSPANAPNVDLKYLDQRCDNAITGIGMQIRAQDHKIEWAYLKGFVNAMVPFSHTSHNDYGPLYKPGGYFKNIIVDACKDRALLFSTNGGTQKPDGIVIQNIIVIPDSENPSPFAFNVGDEATNTKIAHVLAYGVTNSCLQITAGTSGTEIENATFDGNGTNDIDNDEVGLKLTNVIYTGIGGTGSHTEVTCSNIKTDFVDRISGNYRIVEESSLIGAGTNVGNTVDIINNPLANPPTIGAYETEIEKFQIFLQASPGLGGSANLSPGGDYNEGQEVTLTATPNEGYVFSAWEIGGLVVSTDNPFVYTMPANDVNVTINFNELFDITLLVNPNGFGIVDQNPDGPHEEGATVALTAAPGVGNKFDGWYDGIEFLSSNNPFNYTTLGEDKEITGQFSEISLIERILTVNVNDNDLGSVTEISSGPYYEGDTVILEANPINISYFQGFTSLQVPDNSNRIYSFVMPSEDVTITAIFIERSLFIVRKIVI